MGEIAEAMLDGTLCEGCGEFLGGATGFPGYCSRECAKNRGADFVCDEPRRPSGNARKAQRINDERERAALSPKAFVCRRCPKRFRSAIAAHQHERDKHDKGAAGETTKSTVE